MLSSWMSETTYTSVHVGGYIVTAVSCADGLLGGE
jgi:hypothetical protein